MKKRSRGRGGGAETPSSAADSPNTDLKALMRGHSLFFDRLVELIPSRFYLPTADEDRPWYQGLSKAAKASAKLQSRENLKKARRARLDPAAPSSTLDLLKKSISDSALRDADPSPSVRRSESEQEPEAENPLPPPEGLPATYEELRARLHSRIKELHGNCNTRPETINKPRKPKKKRSKKKIRRKKGEEDTGSAPARKRKREEENKEGSSEKKKKKKMSKTGSGGDAGLPTIAFGQVKIGGNNENEMKKRKLSKEQALERAKQIVEVKKDPEKGKKVLWDAAASRAAGQKVHDDPKLLKESMKKEKRRQQKHAEKWKERMEGVEKLRAEKQRSRAENIQERKHQKKMRRIEKREKKLMRPGFEGRKEGYINQ